MRSMNFARRFELRPKVHPAADTPPRLLACDLDGTLLDDLGALRPIVVSAIGAVRASGVHVVIATGRSPWAVADAARTLGLPGPQIVMNGGACVSPLTGEVAWARRLEPDLALEGLAFADGLGSSPLLGFLHGHVRQRQPRWRSLVPDFAAGPHLREVESIASMAGLGPIRVYVPTSRREHARAVAQAHSRFGARASVVYSDEFGLEIMAPNTNKGTALAAVAAAMEIERCDVAALGDGPNDKQMLEWAGRSAVLLPPTGSGISWRSVIAKASQVVPSSADDGAVAALRRFFPGLDFEGARHDLPAA